MTFMISAESVPHLNRSGFLRTDKLLGQEDGVDQTLRQMFEINSSNAAIARATEVTDAFDFLSSLGAPQDPATVWGRAEDGHAPTTAEPCAELGIWIAEQREKKSQLTSSASSKVLVPPAKGLQPALQGHTINKQHVQPSLQPVPKSCSVAQGHLSINSIPRIFKDPTSATKQLHTKRSVQAHALTAVSMTPGDAVFRPSLGNCMQPYSLQLPSGRNNAATAAGLQTVVTNAEQQINQPAMQQNMGPAVGRPAHTDALSSMNTEPSSTSGTATMQSHSYLKASKQHLTSVQPGTPDFGDAPPHAFKRPRHMRNAPE